MCGVFGVINSSTASCDILTGLQQLQHRGQDGAGIVVDNGNTLYREAGMGFLTDIFKPESVAQIEGLCGVGHTRYATVGVNTEHQLQPFVTQDNKIALAHNGNLVNYHDLAERIQREHPDALKTGSDSELILWLLHHHLGDALKTGVTFESLHSALKAVHQEIIGACAIIGVIQGIGLFAFRSPLGMRPLSLGQSQGAYAISSESIALNVAGYEPIDTIQPGELILIENNGRISRSPYTEQAPKHCLFEWVYFARVESTLDNLPVYNARFQLGQSLAEEIQLRGLKPDVVIPVPETSRVAAVALAERLGVPCREGLIKNRYSSRTFILDSDAARHRALDVKLFPIDSEIRGKKVLVVDDSIVRGNTARKIIQRLRESGAAEIYLASTCPPITNPCYFGIDFPSREELPASRMSESELQSWLGVDALIYQTISGLKASLQNISLCDACLTGNYPLDISTAARFTAERQQHRKVLTPST